MSAIIPAAGKAQYYFDNWDTDNGLPQNTVGSILQTRDGYIWLATLDGLVRFDGARFTVYTAGNSPGISNNRFRILYETPDGSLWAATEEFGITRYRNGKFQTFTITDGLLNNSTLTLGAEADGSLLVAASEGIAKFTGERFEPIKTDVSPDARSCAAREGGFWLFDSKGIRRLRNGEMDSPAIAVPFHNDYVPVCYEAKDGTLWLTGKFGEVAAWKNGSLTTFRVESEVPANTRILFAGEDREGTLWFGTSEGLLRLSNGRFEVYGENSGLSDKNLLSFFEDRERIIWVGTSLGGLNRLSRRAISVLTDKNGLAGNSVYPIFEENDGTIWVGANGLTRVRNGIFTRFTSNYSDITAIAKDSAGRLWFGASGGVGFLQNDEFTDFRSSFFFPEGSYTIWAIHEDTLGNIWFGTNRGLVKMREGVFELYTTANGLPSDDIKAIDEDPDGRLLLATYGGLSFLQNGTFQNFTKREGLSSDRIRAIYREANGTLWLGTYDGGLNRFRDGRFTSYTTKNGLFSDGVFQILPDDAGYFWMSSNQGIYRVRKQELEDLANGSIQAVNSEAFGKRDGMLNTECNGGRQPAGIRARDGRLWFPTQEGVAVVDPNAVQNNPLAPPITIESFTIDQKRVEITDDIRIDPNQTNIEIAYTGLSFVKPEQVRFRYKVEGLDPGWVEAGTRRTAYFAHLPPGAYTFSVIAANNSGVWSTQSASVRFTVYPPFWRTWWFLLLMAIAVSLAVYFTLNRRFAKLEQERALQTAFSRRLMAAQESERQRIARELHDDLGQNLLVIKNWALMAQQGRGDQKTDVILEEISGTASQTIDEVRRIAYNLRPYQIEEIGLTRAIEGMLRRTGESTEIEIERSLDNIDGVFSQENEINLFRIIQESVANIVRHSGASRASVAIERSKDTISIRIEDNGKGFSSEDLGGKRGLGLTGIEERARILGGSAGIVSATGNGTSIHVKIDL